MLMNVALLGLGNVGRALAELLLEKSDALRERYGLDVRVVGISTGRHGQVIEPDGLDLNDVLETVRGNASLGESLGGAETFLVACGADLIFESIPTNPKDGEPALSYARQALSLGMHVVTANKGPVAFGYRELTDLAARHGAGFFFESTVMDGAPVLATGREGLPAARVDRIRGIFNSTTNYIITRMEDEGLTFDEALEDAQHIGIAETDPTLDVDGWDASIKTVIL